MATSIVTPSEKKHCDTSRVSFKVSQSDENNTHDASKVSFYDEVLSKADPKFLIPIRRWEKRIGFVTPLVWKNILLITSFQVALFVYFTYAIFRYGFPKWETVLFTCLCGVMGGFGVTAGAHRYWTHRSFKAKLPLQILLMISYSMAGQNSIPNWVRDHRVHHKMSETSADPHDANRGFFFSHVGWLMMRKHPHVIREGNKIDMSDILNDPLVKFHTKYFSIFKMLLCFIIPMVIPSYFWGEPWQISVESVLVRYMLNLHFTWSVNSFAHLWGNKPYDAHIMPSENWKVSFVALGEGWHNYHHTFPWDYKASELAYFINLTTFLIDGFALIGWAYDLKKASPFLIKSVIKNKGPNKHIH
ncbi:acyl-CoA Delta(11) desaturase-like [Melitaea cinxia]|uniref:acyl-CoA Delta(11) desaturase-like n=1 Tax=Melitaea cinxia TaxID=113334 RepID=UPI001E271D73|nr:acyl-CoA Delta(11) desaturase-like [Melitaea cinxia]